jgi:hypothetical protein
MNPEAQAYLAQTLMGIRQEFSSGREWTAEDSQRAFATFSSALQAFKVVGAVDQDEVHDWTNRMLIALGEEPLDPLEPGQMRMIRFGHEAQPVHVPRPIPEFVRLIPATSDATATRFGGRFQVLGVEMYDTQFAVAWRLAPLPDEEAMFADEIAGLNGTWKGYRSRGRK